MDAFSITVAPEPRLVFAGHKYDDSESTLIPQLVDKTLNVDNDFDGTIDVLDATLLNTDLSNPVISAIHWLSLDPPTSLTTSAFNSMPTWLPNWPSSTHLTAPPRSTHFKPRAPSTKWISFGPTTGVSYRCSSHLICPSTSSTLIPWALANSNID